MTLGRTGFAEKARLNLKGKFNDERDGITDTIGKSTRNANQAPVPAGPLSGAAQAGISA